MIADKARIACRHVDPAFDDYFACAMHHIDVIDGDGITLPGALHHVSISISAALIFLCVLMLFRRHLRPWVALVAVAVSLVLAPEQLVREAVRLLVAVVWPRYAGSNPELFQLIALCLSVAALCGWLIRRRNRSRDRAVVALVALAVIVTSCLFHVLYISTGMAPTARESELRLIYLSRLPEADLVANCDALGLACGKIQIDGGGTLPAANTRPEAARAIAQEIARQRSFRDQSLPVGDFWFTWTNLDRGSGGPFSILYRETDDESAHLMTDAVWPRVPYTAGSVIITVQMGTAHAIWFLGGILVIWLHARPPRRRSPPAAAVASVPASQAPAHAAAA